MQTTPSGMALVIHSRQVDTNTSALHLEGEVDVYTTPQFQEALDEQTQSGATRILVNLENVEYMDSTGLSALINGHNVMKENGGALLVVSPRPRIVRLFTITGLTDRLSIHPTESDALAA